MSNWRDVDAPDRNWQGAHEDPIPLLFGRSAWMGFLYRLFSCRSLDGVARTDAGFLRHGTKCFTKTGNTLPFNYWPGWKRGLLVTRIPPLLLLLGGLLLLAELFGVGAVLLGGVLLLLALVFVKEMF